MKSFAKTGLLSLALLAGVATASAQTLFTYGKHAVSKAEFLKAYQKNNTEPATEASLNEYLELYIRFKLKVQAALDAHMDTLVHQRAELQGFRSQIVDHYMQDDDAMQQLMDEAITRSRKDIHLAHIFVPLSVTDAAAKINTAYAALKSGTPFDQVAIAYSADPAVTTNKGDLGYITVFSLPYDIENIAYSTPVGGYSKPFKTSAGYHIIKNLDERPAIGKIRVAQILLAFPPDVTEAQIQATHKRADSLYAVVRAGGDFETLAASFSDDNLTYKVGGELPEFGVGRYTPEFEQAAFALEKDGDISRPVLTNYGFHIIRRLQRKPVVTDTTDANFMEALRMQVRQSDRVEVAKKIFLQKIMDQVGYKKGNYNEPHLYEFVDSVIHSKRAPEFKDLTEHTVLFSFDEQMIHLSDLQNYLHSIRTYDVLQSGKTNAQLYQQFIDQTAMDYYRSHLEQYNPAFAYQMNEFKEGNLLFEIMQQKVWDAAAADSAGLQKYYQQSGKKYYWEPSADAVIFTAVNENIAGETRKKLQAGEPWESLVVAGNGSLQADSGRFELAQLPVVEKTNFTNGLITAPVKSDMDKTLTFCQIITVYPDRKERSFEDARGFVINDYQSYLEEQWIQSLKEQYPVRIHKKVFKSLLK